VIPELNKFARSAYSNHDTIQNTYDLSVLASEIEGDFVECGVALGAQIGVMGYALDKKKSSKKVYAFDSFAGIPLAGKFDTVQPGIGPIDPNRHIPSDPRDLLVSSGVAAFSLETVKTNIKQWELNSDRYVFVEGWFQNTLPSASKKIDKISLLRLDGDLYDSTKVCLDYLHHKVQRGGFVIVDDYALVGCQRAVQEYFSNNTLRFVLTSVDPNKPEVHWYQVS